MKNISDVRSEIVKHLKCKKHNFKVNMVLHRKPVQLLKNWGNVLSIRSSRKNMSCRVLNQLKLVQEYVIY